MPIYTLAQNEDGANVRIDGVEVAAFVNKLPRPLISIPLRARPLSASIFAGEKAKLQRARKHLAELVTLVKEYMSAKPFHSSEVGDAVIVRVEKPVPQEINVALGDVVHNLRAALDLLVCDMVRVNKGQINRCSAFPITKDGIKPSHVKKQLAGVSHRAIKVLSRITHNQSWNEALLLLHDLDIMDKHNSLVAVGAATVRVHVRGNRGQTTVSMLKRQIELTRIGRLFIRSAGFSGPCTAADHRCDLSQETRTAQSESSESSGDSLLNSRCHEEKPNFRPKSERAPRTLCWFASSSVARSALA